MKVWLKRIFNSIISWFGPRIGIVLIGSLILNGGLLLVELYVVSPIGYGGMLLITLTLLAAIPFLLVSLVTIPVSLIAAMFERIHPLAFRILLVSLQHAALGILVLYAYGSLRRAGQLRVMHNAEPLIAAIRQYESDQGVAPQELEQLIPDYLSKIPSTGLPAYSEYQYWLLDKNELEENTWTISLRTPLMHGDLNFLLYMPNENYPPRIYGGWVEPIENWAYVHE